MLDGGFERNGFRRFHQGTTAIAGIHAERAEKERPIVSDRALV